MEKKKLESIIIDIIGLENQADITPTDICGKVVTVLTEEYKKCKENYQMAINNQISEDINTFICQDFVIIDLVKDSLDQLSLIKKCFNLYVNGYVESFILENYPEFIKRSTYTQEPFVNENNTESITSKRSIGFCRY